MKKRLVSLVLTLCMVLSAVPFTASAAEVAADLDDAETYQAKFNSEIESETGLTWKTLQLAVLNYNLANEYVNGLEEGDTKSAAQARVNDLTAYYEGITELDMSGKDIADSYSHDLGALVILTNLETLDVSGTGLAEFGALWGLTNLKTLNVSNTEFDDEDFGALIQLENLKTLDISDTQVTKLETIWYEDQFLFPDLTTLNAKNLELASISGLMEIAEDNAENNEFFQSVKWDLSDSTCPTQKYENNVLFVDAIKAYFEDADAADNFVAPTVKKNDLEKAETQWERFSTEEMSWVRIQGLAYYYGLAQKYVEGLTGEEKTAAEKRLATLTENINSVKVLNMSYVQFPDGYNKDLGALVFFPNLERVDVSGVNGITDFGALAQLSNLKWLNISNTDAKNFDFMWDEENSEVTLPKLSTLIAKNLRLESVSGLVEIVEQDGFSAENLKWDLTFSTCIAEKYNENDYFADAIQEKFADSFIVTKYTVNNTERVYFSPDYTKITVSCDDGHYSEQENGNGDIMMPVGHTLTVSFVSEYPINGTYGDYDSFVGHEISEDNKTVTFTVTKNVFARGKINFFVAAPDTTKADWQSGNGVVYKKTIDVLITSHQITFMNGEEEVAKVDYDANGLEGGLPAAPTKAGYTFKGWFDAAEGGNQITAETVFTGATTVYAQWTANAVVVPPVVNPSTPSTPSTPSEPTTPTEETVVTTAPNGTEGTTVVDANGKVTEAEATIPASVAAEAAKNNTPVALPIEPVSAPSVSFLAPEITVNTNSTVNVPVEIPVEKPTTGTVVILVNEDGTETILATSTVTADGVVADLPDGAVVKVVDNSKSFSDVNSSDWFSDAVNFVAARGLLGGTGAHEFGEAETTSRAMVWTMLARLSGVDTTGGSNWYETAQNWAVQNGVSDGSNPTGEITREQLVTMLWRFVGEPSATTGLDSFKDASNVSDWSKDASKWAVENTVMNGSEGALNPQGITTRAQLAQFVMNFINNAI